MRLKITLFCLFAAMIFSSVSAAQEASGDPASLLKSTTNRIFTQLSENMEEYTENPEALRELVRTDLMPLIDVRYSARLILGRAGRGLDSEKINAFADAMSKLLVDRYSQGLLYFKSPEQIRVLPIRGDLNDRLTRVRTRIALPSGGDAPIDYAFRKTKDGWKAFDVIVEGISYVTTYRNQIMPDVQANGIDSVIERLNSGDLQLSESDD